MSDDKCQCAECKIRPHASDCADAVTADTAPFPCLPLYNEDRAKWLAWRDAAVAEYKQDAERYRYLRANAELQDRNGPGVYWYLPRWDRRLPVGERLDNAIDADIAAAIRAEAAKP